MIDYTSAAKESDARARGDFGYTWTPRLLSRIDNPVACHRHEEALASLEDDGRHPDLESAAEAADRIERDRIEGRILMRTPAHVNPHGD